MIKVFIDGREGTTGLRIDERLSYRDDIELIVLPEELRKDTLSRKEALNKADIAFLCLPDAAAIEAVSLIENNTTRVIDASTAHRTNKGWAYGLPELSHAQKELIKNSNRVAVPGCHASGFVALIKPIVEAGILPKDANICCHCLTGYSGGGKKMIAEIRAEDNNNLQIGPRQYGISQGHKHLKEMTATTCIENPPHFTPIVGDFYSGMLMTVQLFKSQLNSGFTSKDIKKIYKELYTTPILGFAETMDENGFISSVGLEGKDNMLVSVSGNEDRIILTAM